MKKWTRFENALAISAGACNPSGIALAIVDACQECRSHYGDVCDDPAIRLMVSQLAFITGVWDGVSDYHKSSFHADSEACRLALQNAPQEVLSI